MNLHELVDLNDSELNNLILYYDGWKLDENKKQVFKSFGGADIIFNTDEFCPFSNETQAQIVLGMSGVDFSLIQTNDNVTWGLNVFEDKGKKFLLLKSSSKIKSCLLFVIAVKSCLLVDYSA